MRYIFDLKVLLIISGLLIFSCAQAQKSQNSKGEKKDCKLGKKVIISTFDKIKLGRLLELLEEDVQIRCKLGSSIDKDQEVSVLSPFLPIPTSLALDLLTEQLDLKWEKIDDSIVFSSRKINSPSSLEEKYPTSEGLLTLEKKLAKKIDVPLYSTGMKVDEAMHYLSMITDYPIVLSGRAMKAHPTLETWPDFSVQEIKVEAILNLVIRFSTPPLRMIFHEEGIVLDLN